jgi:DNA-binding MurR/RpiR family transcriptional regulator
MSFRSMVQRNAVSLTAGDRKIVDFFIEYPEDAVMMTSAEVAKRTGVHESTVSRLGKKLGYASYSDMRNDIRLDIRQGRSNTGIWYGPVKERGLNPLIQEEIQKLSHLNEFVSQDALDAVAKDIVSARRVFLFGREYARGLVDYLGRRLRCFGIDVVSLTTSGRDLAEHMVTFRKEDILIAFGFRVEVKEVTQLIRQAQVEGAVSVLITDPGGQMTMLKPTHLLMAPRGRTEGRHTLVVPLVICYAIEFAIHHLIPEQVEKSLERLADLGRMYADDPIPSRTSLAEPEPLSSSKGKRQ